MHHWWGEKNNLMKRPSFLSNKPLNENHGKFSWLISFTAVSRLSSYSPVSKTVRMWVTKKDDATVKQKQLRSFITINTFYYFGKVHPILTDFFHSDNHQCELDRWSSVPISIFFYRISDLNFGLKLHSIIDHESWLELFTPYLCNVFLTKLQRQIWPRKSRDRINPNGALWS